LLHVYHKEILKRKNLENTEKQWIHLHTWQETYYVTKIAKNADLSRNLCDSKASIVGKICDNVCMKHDILSRHSVLPVLGVFVEKKEGENNVILSVVYFW